jgi:hypothetical protein
MIVRSVSYYGCEDGVGLLWLSIGRILLGGVFVGVWYGGGLGGSERRLGIRVSGILVWVVVVGGSVVGLGGGGLGEDGEPSLLSLRQRVLVYGHQRYKRATSVEAPLNGGGVLFVFCRFAPATLGGVLRFRVELSPMGGGLPERSPGVLGGSA